MTAPTIRIINADVLAGLSQLEDESVNCCVTSPPYWGLRDYGTASWIGGRSSCDHVSGELRTGLGLAALGEKYSGGGHKAARADKIQFRAECGKCGAARVDQQIGLEKTPEEFVARLVAVFREVRRVLRKDGVLFMNLGDSYSRDPGKGGSGPNGKHDSIPDYGNARRIMSESRGSSDGKVGRGDRAAVANGGAGLKPKDLVGIPWMTAFALRADGWYLRQEIIWAKPNPMPESVRDRCTKAHEHIFLMSKSERYWYDADAIREGAQYSGTNSPSSQASPYGQGFTRRADEMKRIGSKGNAKTFRGGVYTGNKAFENSEKMERDSHGNAPNETLSRNKRSVWTIATQPYSEAHFATFPEELPETCILAGCPTGGTVLDPFGGAGTTAVVADRLGRNAILLELNPEYAAMAERRIARERLERGAGTMVDVAKAALPLTPLEALMRGE
jgi:DNA modification methylase